MDKAWLEVYEANALKDLPVHSASCWTEEGFKELFHTTFKIIKSLNDVSSVLDVGCGLGVYCEEFQKKGFEVTGVDYAKNVIQKAKNNFPKIKFVVGSAYDLPFDDDSFDLVICIGVLQCVYEPEKIISELLRISKKYVLISTLLRKQKFDDPLRFLHKKLETDSWPTRDYHPDELVPLLENNGFSTSLFFNNDQGNLLRDGFFILGRKHLKQ